MKLRISDLPSEILGQVFSKLDDKERCRTIPLVSSHFRRVHVDNPPRPAYHRTEADASQPLTHSLVEYLITIAPGLEYWGIGCSQPDSAALLVHMMEKAAICTPNLHTLEVDVDLEGYDESMVSSIRPIVNSVLTFTQIERLVKEPWIFSPAGDVSQVQGFTSLQRLESLLICFAPSSSITPDQADSLWTSLSALSSLEFLSISLSTVCGDERPLLPFFLTSLTLLTQISNLQLRDIATWLDDRGSLPEKISTLTQLTDLMVYDENDLTPAYFLPSAALQPISSLTKLESLLVGIDDADMQTTGLALQSSALTSLSIRAGIVSASVLARFIPPSSPCLHNLRALYLACQELEDFPAQLASSLKALTQLSLWNNQLPLLPYSLSHLTGLQDLDVGFNRTLQLRPSDLETLEAMPLLRKMNLRRGPMPAFTEESVWTLMAISRRFPDLELPGP